MITVNVTNRKIVWATPFIAHGTVLDVQIPDTHDWDTSWGSSITKVTLENGIKKKVVIGHDKMGNVMAMLLQEKRYDGRLRKTISHGCNANA
jgi:hypothetical protein